MTEDALDFATAWIIGLLAWFFGGLDGFIKVLIAFSVIDYVTGVSAAYVRRELSSAIGFKGIAKKVMIFCFVGIAHVVDKHMLGDTATLRTAVALFYIGNEGISIVENAKAMGVPIPEVVYEKLHGLTKEGTTQKKKAKREADTKASSPEA